MSLPLSADPIGAVVPNAVAPAEPIMRNVVTKNIPAQGDCFYNSILYSLTNHPHGNLIIRHNLPNTMNSLREYITDLPDWRACITEQYDSIRTTTNNNLREELGVVEQFNLNKDGNIIINNNGNPIQKIALPYYWMNILTGSDNERLENYISLEDFIERAIEYMRTPQEFASICEIRSLTRSLDTIGIELRIVYGIPDRKLSFGTEENPIIYIVFNGRDHYDSLDVVAEGGSLKRRSTRRSTRRSARRSFRRRSTRRRSASHRYF